MTETALTFGEFMELILARLVEADREEPGTWVDMLPLAEQLKANIPDDWVFDAREALETRGLVNPLKVLGRTALARLTAEGRLFVEAGGNTGIINEYRQQPSNFVFVSGSGHQVAVGVEGDVTQTSVQTGVPHEVWKLLDQIEASVANADDLDDEQRHNAIKDILVAREQLQRPVPNKAVAVALLDPLAKLATVGGFVAKVITLLG